MNFGFTEEQELLRKTARDFLAERSPMKRVRDVMEDSDRAFDAELWKALAELGWTGLALPEELGGAGLSIVELCIVLEQLGRSLAPVPFVPTVAVASAIDALGDASQRRHWLPRIASGEVAATLALAEERGSEAPEDVALSAEGSGAGYALSGSKLFVPDAAAAHVVAAVARTDRGLGLFLVPRDAAGLRVEPMRSIDRLRPLSAVRFDAVRVPAEALVGGPDAWPRLERVLDRIRVMLCAEMVGGAEKCLEDSVAYAKQRVQFGKPIGVNQAIKHKCADMLFEVESARSITYYAAWADREGDADAPLLAAMAKAYVSDAYRHAAAENIQIHGGVGFTWEYDCHLYFKRAKSDECWLGDATHHRERVARMLAL
jgi:alkylation response protein AidB-like acyl-CoA dehydrogenase